MRLVGAGDQQARHFLYDASGTITSGSAPQLILPVSPARSVLLFHNISSYSMFLQIGSATATCTISSGAVNAITVTNAGFGFSKPPVVRFLGGGTEGNSAYLGAGVPLAQSPSNYAVAHCVMTGAAPNQSVSSISIDNGGSGYACAPFVFIMNSDLDPNGCADPSLNSGNGIFCAAAGGSYYMNGTCCPTDSVAVFCAHTGAAFTCKYMT